MNPRWFRYGSPTIYLHAAVDAAHYLYLCSKPEDARESIRSLDEIKTQFDTKWQWTISHPSFFRWNRLATAIAGAIAAGLAYAIARTWVDRWPAIFAATVVAGAAAHIEVSTTIRSDIFAGVLALGAVAAALRAIRQQAPWTLVGAFFLAGLAASTKYNLVIACTVPLAALSLAAWRGHPLARPSLWVAAFVVPPVAFVIGSPYALLDMPTFLADAGAEVSHYKQEGQGAQTVAAGWPHVVHQLGEFRASVGVLTLWLALVGLGTLLRNRLGWIALVFPAIYVPFMTRTTVAFHHNFVVLYPFIGIAAACGARLLYRTLAQRAPRPAASAFALAVGALALAHVTPEVVEAVRIHRTPETRTRAVRLANELAVQNGWRKIGIASELRIHRLDLAELELDYEIAPIGRLVQLEDVDAILVPSAVTARQRDTEQAKKRARAATDQLPEKPALAEVEGGPLFLKIRSVHPGVRIVETR